MTTFKEMAEQMVFEKADAHASAYAEPGYDLPEDSLGIVFANWNEQTGRDGTVDKTMPRLAVIAEWLGYEIEWSDEWLICDCGKGFRTSPDGHGWTMHGAIYDGWTQCGDCITEDPTEYLESLEDNPRRANTVLNDLEKYGYRRVHEDGYVGGMGPRQNDDPAAILEKLHSQGIKGAIFSIDTVGQFEVQFGAYVMVGSLYV